ncbi:MAG: BON domain-containing protein [Actinomycetota bacterium]
MITDEDLIGDVSDELFWDPKVPAEAIAVDAADGKVTLRGTVGSPREKYEAKKAAERVRGVISVHEKLQVRLMDHQKREDAEIRADVLQALMLDALVPDAVDAKVKHGVVTLTGTAEWQYQRDEAILIACSIVGALDVIDMIELKHPPRPDDVRDLIDRAWKRNAALEADDLHIDTSGGKVAIKGTVSSWVEHDEAIDAAWSAPGVTSVDDRLKVVY